jgi:hypothetical protein
MRRRSSRLLISFLVVVAAACGDTEGGGAPDSSLRPDPWATLEGQFLESCAQQTPAGHGAAVADYCACVFGETVEFYGTPEMFTEAGVLDGGHGFTLEPLLEPAAAGCADLHLN